MKTSKHSESEIIKALKQMESGITADIALDNKALKEVIEKKIQSPR